MTLLQRFCLFIYSLLLLGILCCPAQPVAAQSILRWSPQQQIPGYFDKTLPPYLVADQNRTVHALTSQRFGEGNAGEVVILYSRWTVAGGWTEPVDVLISPLYEARLMGVFLDSTGILHVLFFGGNDNGATMYYATAAAANADKATAWSAPLPIGDNAITPSIAALVGDDKGHLVVVYNGNLGEGNSLYAVTSSDNGATWTTPNLVWSTYSSEFWPSDLALDYGASGQIHAVWNYVDKQGKNVTGFYANLQSSEAVQWSEPVELDKSLGLGIAAPSVKEYQGEVFVLFNNGVTDGGAPALWVRRTADSGQSWSHALRAFASHVGRNGAAAMVVDSNDGLHIFFGQRTRQGKEDIHGMWHSRLQRGMWSEVQPLVSGPLVQSTDDSAFDPGDARAVVSQGNVLLVTWRTDPGNGANGVWYSFAQIEAPALPVVPLPVPLAMITPTPTPISTPTPNPTLAPTPTPILVAFETGQAASVNGVNKAAAPLLAGLVPVIMLITSIFVVTKSRRTQ